MNGPRKPIRAAAFVTLRTGVVFVFLFAVHDARGGEPSPAVGSKTDEHRARVPAAVEADPGRRPPVPADDWTFRPTVVVRRGTSQGSGTIIASVEGETLILTAAHVVKAKGPVSVELHRYNLGLENRPRDKVAWPRVVQGTVATSDDAGDVAIVRLRKLVALPFVARLAANDEKATPGSVVTSIGIDWGKKLTHWSGRLVETTSFKLNESHEARPFLITEKTPEHGRSGGGLFTASGELVGVCVGHASLDEAERKGVFAASESIRLLLDDQDFAATVARSQLRIARRLRERSKASQAFTRPPLVSRLNRDDHGCRRPRAAGLRRRPQVTLGIMSAKTGAYGSATRRTRLPASRKSRHW